MAEQQPDLLARVEALERQNQRMQARQAVLTVLLVAALAWSLRPFPLPRPRDLDLSGGGTTGPNATMYCRDTSSTLQLASSRGTATAAIDADRREGADAMLMYDGRLALLGADKDGSQMRVENAAGQAKAAATAGTTGFYLYDSDGTLRAELALNGQGPALVFYDAKGKELRHFRATGK